MHPTLTIFLLSLMAGLGTGMGGLIAILLHNIPEGMATALPLCKSGVSRWDSFRVAFLSGLAEPVGALLAAFFLTSFQNFIPGA
jgi:ZIP family zinc transporter